MQEQVKRQHIPVKVYRTDERLMTAAPMAGLEPENILVEVTGDGRLILHGDQRALLKEVKELLVDEWSVGVYHRELALPVPVNAVCANVTYGKPDLFLLEHHLPDTDGLALYDLLRETKELASIPAIIFGVPLPTQAHAVIKTQRVVLLGILIELEGLGID